MSFNEWPHSRTIRSLRSAIAEFGGRLIVLLSISRDDASLDPLIRARSWRGFTYRAAPEKMVSRRIVMETFSEGHSWKFKWPAMWNMTNA